MQSATIQPRTLSADLQIGERPAQSAMTWDLRLSIFFLFFYYIRPQDWVPGMSGMNIVQPLIVCWTFAVYNERSRTRSKLLETPHDWLMVIYLAYVVWTSNSAIDTFKAFVPNTAFYFLTLLSLTSIEKLKIYLKWWLLMILGVALIGVLSLYGIDPTGARAMTSAFEGRLCIGTWMHRNPNALGHSVTVLFAAAYFFYFWKGNPTKRLIVFPLIVFIAGQCVLATQSKGSFIVGAALLVMTFVIGRPWRVKLIALSVALTLGVSALSFLPRMQNVDNLRSQAGVEGRLMAWDLARGAFKAYPTGEGYKEFEAFITWEGETQRKATHSSYVQIGADLGQYGLFIFVSLLWATAYTLIRLAKIGNKVPEDFERCRRVIFILLLGYAFSSWMVNKEYHPEYFLLVAVAASLQRIAKRTAEASETQEDEEPTTRIEAPATLQRVSTTVSRDSARLDEKKLKSEDVLEEEQSIPEKVASWRFGIPHIVIGIGLTVIVYRYWVHQIESL